jgi:amicyanin
MRSTVLGSMRGTVTLTAFLTMLLATMLVGAGCGDAGETTTTGPPTTPIPGGTQVAIVDSSFQPDEVVIAPGEAVTWINEDPISHDVASDDGQTFESPLLGRGDSYSFTFEAPGTYPYHCPVHPFMRAVVIVE